MNRLNLSTCENKNNIKEKENKNKTKMTYKSNISKFVENEYIQTSTIGYHATKGLRDYMEDTYQIVHFTVNNKSGVFYGIFDGHGGSDVSMHLIHNKNGLFPYLIENIKNSTNKDIPTVIKNAYLAYDKILFSKKLIAGSTACVILIYDNNLYLINAGDSRGFVFGDGKLHLVSNDHKPNKPIEKMRIYKAGHYINPFKIYNNKPKSKPEYGDIVISNEGAKIFLNGQLVPINAIQLKQIEELNKTADTHRICNSLSVSRGFGDFYLKVNEKGKYMGAEAAVSPIPDVNMINLKQFKNNYIYIVIASDGFWDVNNITENFKNNIKKTNKFDSFCKILVDETLKKGSTDNISIICDKIYIK